MQLTTADYEKRLADAIDYYHSYNGDIPVQDVA